jgi:uncharacterized membrane protein YedE/YeeE
MENFTPLSSTIGGILIGLSATIMLLNLGRLAGISSILSSLLKSKENDRMWSILFLAGLVIGTSTYVFISNTGAEINMNPFQLGAKSHMGMVIAGGLLVGFGTQIGSGCTSGHGVCGLGRLSMRSLVATIIFLTAAVITVSTIRILTGG